MERAGRFLNLASLVSVLLAAVAVAMAARRYSHRHRDRIALMKCMGASQSMIFRSSVLQLIILLDKHPGFVFVNKLVCFIGQRHDGAHGLREFTPLIAFSDAFGRVNESLV